MFLDVLAETTKNKCGLTPDEPLVLGVSGGADSLALMLGLVNLGYHPIVAHLDHALRPESTEDAAFVKRLAKAQKLRFVSTRIDVGRYAEEQGQSIEEAAREVRYQFLFDQARRQKAQAVAVAHHADDQVETVLMHFLRGAGLPGLSGMSYRRTFSNRHAQIPIVRPLLGIWREEIEAFVAEAGLTPREDATNRDLRYFRNRLRHALMPELETYNPQIRQVLWRTAEVLGEENRFIESLAAGAWEKCFIKDSHDRVQLDLQAFRSLATAMQRRVLRRAIERLRPDLRDIGFAAIDRGLAFIEVPSESGEIDLVARLNLAVLGDRLIVKTWGAVLPDWGKPLLVSKDQTTLLDLGTPVELRHSWRVEMDEVHVPEDPLAALGAMGPYEVWLDAEKLVLPLTVRGRKAGERWQPLGMAGHSQSLQDFFINEKVPPHLRDLWPLVCSAGEVVWAVGLRPSEAFKLNEQSQRILHFKVMQVA
ncbi:MAG: tRNA lysidine(34) synthetase TilS [Brevefilum sp.]